MPETLTPWFVLVTSFVAAMTAVGVASMFLWRRVFWPGFRGLVEDAVAPMEASLAGVHEIVHRELTPNGGGSIKDRVSELAVQSERVEKNLLARNESTDAKLAGLDRRLATLEVRLSRETQKVIESVTAATVPPAVETLQVSIEAAEVGKETLNTVSSMETKLDEAIGKLT